jgi:hypothetical protein
VQPASSTSRLFMPVASTQSQKIVSSLPLIETPRVTPPIPMPSGPMPTYPPIPTPPDQPVDVSSLVGARASAGPYSDMSTMPYTPAGVTSKDVIAAQQANASLPGMTTMGEGGQVEQPPSLPTSNKTIYYVGGAVVALGVGYYLYKQSKKNHRPNCSSRRRLRTR